jgi:putative FmdB family regulatory protein
MPIFEYRCHRCDRRFETLLSRAEAESAQPCPACGAAVGGKDRPEDRLLSVFAAAGSAGRESPDAMPMAGGCGQGACATGSGGGGFGGG